MSRIRLLQLYFSFKANKFKSMRQGAFSMKTNHALRSCDIALIFLLSLMLQACSGSQPSSGNPSAPTPPPAYDGYVDEVTCVSIIAWGYDSRRPNEPIKIDIYDGNSL